MFLILALLPLLSSPIRMGATVYPSFAYSAIGLLQDGNIGVGVFPQCASAEQARVRVRAKVADSGVLFSVHYDRPFPKVPTRQQDGTRVFTVSSCSDPHGPGAHAAGAFRR